MPACMPPEWAGRLAGTAGRCGVLSRAVRGGRGTRGTRASSAALLSCFACGGGRGAGAWASTCTTSRRGRGATACCATHAARRCVPSTRSSASPLRLGRRTRRHRRGARRCGNAPPTACAPGPRRCGDPERRCPPTNTTCSSAWTPPARRSPRARAAAAVRRAAARLLRLDCRAEGRFALHVESVPFHPSRARAQASTRSRARATTATSRSRSRAAARRRAAGGSEGQGDLGCLVFVLFLPCWSFPVLSLRVLVSALFPFPWCALALRRLRWPPPCHAVLPPLAQWQAVAASGIHDPAPPLPAPPGNTGVL